MMLVDQEQSCMSAFFQQQKEVELSTGRRKLRNKFAAAYLTGMVGSCKATNNEHQVAKDAFRFAVAMVTESERF